MNKLSYAAACTLAAFSCVANNIETWNTLQVQTSLRPDLQAGVLEESRIGVDQDQTTKKLDEFHTTMFIDWRAYTWMSLGMQDDFVLIRSGSDKRYKHDNRPGINLAFYQSAKGFSFMNRSRFIMRDLEGENPHFRYRNLSKVTMPEMLQAFDRSVKPYVSYEWYFDESSKHRYIRKNDKFDQFWTDFGLQCKVSDCCTVSVFYRLAEVKSMSSHSWSPGHVIGACMTFQF